MCQGYYDRIFLFDEVFAPFILREEEIKAMERKKADKLKKLSIYDVKSNIFAASH